VKVVWRPVPGGEKFEGKKLWVKFEGKNLGGKIEGKI